MTSSGSHSYSLGRAGIGPGLGIQNGDLPSSQHQLWCRQDDLSTSGWSKDPHSPAREGSEPPPMAVGLTLVDPGDTWLLPSVEAFASQGGWLGPEEVDVPFSISDCPGPPATCIPVTLPLHFLRHTFPASWPWLSRLLPPSRLSSHSICPMVPYHPPSSKGRSQRVN